jgi:hypothetical protein
MQIRGVQHDSLTDIANIRTTLKGYGRGFPIIKELIQNAEDSNASFIHIGWHPGFKDHAHSLLRVPALCMVNDGPLKEEHKEAICRLGLGTKAGDKKAIGRFGLGLKSVFHLSEAFFFMASDPLDGESVCPPVLFNPWHPSHHTEWDTNIDGIQDIIYKAIEGFLREKPKPWFALWLPLRTRALCGKVDPIIKEWPGETNKPSETINDLFRDELGDVLSFLKCLREIRYSIWHDGALHPHYRLSVDSSSGQIQRVFVGIEHRNNQTLFMRDWELLEALNKICDKPATILKLPDETETNYGNYQDIILNSQKTIEKELPQLQLPFQLPDIELVGVLLPDPGDT